MTIQSVVVIADKAFVDGAWHVGCSVASDSGTRIGVEYVQLSEQASDEDLMEAIAMRYAAEGQLNTVLSKEELDKLLRKA
jgi:hypothetical protein